MKKFFILSFFIFGASLIAQNSFAQNCTGFQAAATNSGLMNCTNTTNVITASATGGTPPYNYDWGAGFSSTPTWTVSAPNTYTVTVSDTQGCTATATTTVLQDITAPIVNITASITTLTCNSGAAVLTASSNSSYYWSNNEQTANITVTDAGTYTVTASGANGCTASSQVVITGYAIPILTMFPSNGFVCTGGMLSVLAMGSSNTYLWNTVETTPHINPTQIGVYAVTVTNAGGCSASASINITMVVSNTLQLSFTNVQGITTCRSTDGSATIIATGGISPYNYRWSLTPSPPYATVANLYSGVYTATVTDAAGCSTSATVAISNPSNVQASFTNVVQPTCNQLGRVTAAAIGGSAPYYYYWNTGQYGSLLQQVHPQNNSQTYTVTVADANGCSATASILFNAVPAPLSFQIMSSAPAFNCQIDSIKLWVVSANSNYIYTWNTGVVGDTVKVAPYTLGANYYSVTATNGQYCYTTSSINLTSLNSMPAYSPNIHHTNCITNNGSIYLQNNFYNPNVTYLWNNGATSQNIINLAAGWYSVTMSLANCDTIHRNYYVSTVCQTTISGYVLNDTNNNCTRDTSDLPIPYNGSVRLQNTQTQQNYWFYPDGNGFYSAIVDTGHYHITCYYYNGFNCGSAAFACTSANGINLYAQNPNTPYIENNFYMQSPTSLQTDLAVSAYQQTARPAFPRQFYLYYRNSSNVAANNVVLTFTHDSAWHNISMLYGNAPTSSTSTTKIWNLGTVLPASAYWSNGVQFTMELPQTTPIGINMNYSASINSSTADCNLSNNLYSWQNTTTNSFDPNDKTLLNPHNEQGGTLNDGSPLRYQIRFQNTGTDTAYTVIVRDTIDLTHLDKNSFKVLAASHNVRAHWEGTNILVFEFPNIYLVDSLHNEFASHGWLQFSISPLANTPMYSTVNNTAAIVFDYNNAVLTNTVHTTFVPFLATENTNGNGNNTNGNHELALTLQPNPANTTTRLTTDQTDYSLTLTDVFGKILWQKSSIKQTVVDILLESLPAATYFINLRSKEGVVTEKLVKMD